jgi:hypothetical protein
MSSTSTKYVEADAMNVFYLEAGPEVAPVIHDELD